MTHLVPGPLPLRCVSLRLGPGAQGPAVHDVEQLLGSDFIRLGKSVDVHYWCSKPSKGKMGAGAEAGGNATRWGGW